VEKNENDDASVWDAQERPRRQRLLEVCGLAQAAGAPLDVIQLAGDLDVHRSTIRMELGELSSLGLILDGLEEGLPPILLNAGRQFLAGRLQVRPEILRFLPPVIDDLNAREALFHEGTILVDESRTAILNGDPVEHAPPRTSGL
jgi:hypothetical protein